jgi:hypothetical protein
VCGAERVAAQCHGQGAKEPASRDGFGLAASP